MSPFRLMIVTTGMVLASAATLSLTGCTKTSPSTTSSLVAAATTQAVTAPVAVSPQQSPVDDHAHKPGSHGGLIVPIGADSYHAEAVIEKGGTFRLLTLGKDESRVQEVEIQAVKAYVKVIGQPDAVPVELSAVPQEGDVAGKTSQFLGELPEDLRGRSLDITIPNLRINDERFRIGFTMQTAHQEDMPAGLPVEEEQALYLTPGGKYTEVDIAANGRTTASQKFKGILSLHDMKPKAGDRLCPITLTKANPKFTWIVDGKPYEFCCPPCVDEFVKMAKEEPDKVQAPDTFIK